MKLITIPLQLILVLIKTIWIHYFGKGPDIKEWSLGFHIVLKLSKSWLTGFIGVRNTTFRKVHNAVMYSKAFGCETVHGLVPNQFRKLSHEIVKAHSIKEFGTYYLDEDDKWENSPPLEIFHIVPNKLKSSGIKKSLYYLHGGGFVFGHPSCYHHNLGNIAKEVDIQVWTLNYRKAPEYCMPAIFEDMIAGYLFLTSKSSEGGQEINPSDIIAGGDSAGGLMSSQLIHFLRDCNDLKQIAGAVLWSPGLDLRGILPTFSETDIYSDILPDPPSEPIKITNNYYIKNTIDVLCYYGGSDKDKEKMIKNGGSTGPSKAVFSPLYNPISNQDYSNLPPILIQAGGTEYLRNEGYNYSKRIFTANLSKKSLNPKLPAQTLQIYEGMPHVFMIVPLAPPRGVAIKRTANFINLCLNEELQDIYQRGVTEHISISINGTSKVPIKGEFGAYHYKYNGDVEVLDPNYPIDNTTNSY